MTELLNVPTPEVQPPKEYKRIELHEDHQRVIDYIISHKLGEYDEKTQRLSVDTIGLKEAHTNLNLKGKFETNSSGKNYPNDRNSHGYPVAGGAWKIYRHGDAEETDTWEVNENGHTWCWLNKAPRKIIADPAGKIVEDAIDIYHDKLFHSKGIVYVELLRKGKIEILMIKGEIYRRVLRCRYADTYHQVPKQEHIKNAIEQLVAKATEENEEIEVYARIAHFDGKIIIDTADKDGNVIEIDKTGYRVISNPPVKFLRTEKMLPLPLPVPGGKIDDLKPFFNLEDEDFPLLIGAIFACFSPSGTYPTISIIGGDGRAKTYFALMLMRIIDPSIVTGCPPPKTEEDMILSARQRWLYSLDNLQELLDWISDAICRLNSGNAMERRTKYEDSATSAFQAKRPCLLTSIVDIVKNNDLKSRTIPFELPRVKEFKTEDDLDRDFKDALPKILGVIYTALACGLANKKNIKLTKTTRLADVCIWMQACEATTGLETGSILRRYFSARASAIAESLSSDIAEKVMNLCEEFNGTGKELAISFGLPVTDKKVQEMVGELRKLQTALEYVDITVTFHKKKNGKRIISITNLKYPSKPKLAENIFFADESKIENLYFNEFATGEIE